MNTITSQPNTGCNVKMSHCMCRQFLLGISDPSNLRFRNKKNLLKNVSNVSTIIYTIFNDTWLNVLVEVDLIHCSCDEVCFICGEHILLL